MVKTFVLLREAALASEKSTRSFGCDNNIIIPMSIVESIHNKRDNPEKLKVANKLESYLGSFDPKKLISQKGVKQDNGSVLRVKECGEVSPEILKMHSLNDMYKRAFQVCLDLMKELSHPVILISQNPSIRMKAESLGIISQPFKDEIFPKPCDQYKGKCDVYTTKSNLDEFHDKGFIPINKIYKYNEIDWVENLFLIMKAESGGDSLGRYTEGQIIKLQYQEKNIFSALNVEQKMLMECLLAPPEIAPLVIVKGGAGTGKTFCALAAALNRLKGYSNMKEGIYDQILVGTPTVTIDEDLGYLPGNIDDKVGPYIGGARDSLSELFRIANPDAELNEVSDQVNEIFERKLIEIQPIGFLRGRSIPRRFFLVDETQNVKPEIIKDITTRMAQGSKIILAGDPTQVNTYGLDECRNGLVYASEKFKGCKLCWQVELDSKKTIRSELAKVAQEIL